MKKHFLKHPLFILIILFFAVLFTAEAFLRNFYGVPPSEHDPPEFKHQYVNIYKRFFEKVRKGNKVFYKSIPEKAPYNNTEFPAVKEPGALRFFILGGSVAASFPLSNFIGSLIPDRNIEIVDCGMGGVDSYREYLVAKEILSYAPDLVILLSGNNENYKRYKVNLTAYYINKFFRKFWTYRKLQDYVANWIKNQESDPLTIREKRLRNYERNVRAVVRLLRSRKVPIVLCTLPGNFKDCPPGGYLPLDKQFILSSFLLENKDYYSAIKGFQEFLVRNPDDRFGLYFLGRAYEGIKEYSKAKEYYLKAWDLGFTGGQAGPTSNEIIRRICREDKAILADFETLFMQVSPYGLCGRNLLYDYCHLHPAAYSLFAECIAQEIFKNKELCVSLFGKTMEIPKSLSSLNEPLDFLQKGDSKWAMLISAWDVVSGGFNENESGYLFDERSISYLETLYLMDPDMFWKLQFFKEEIFSEFSQYPWIREFSLTYNSNSQRLWARLLCYMGETYRRVGEYQKAIVLLDKSIAMNGSNYLPYLDKALIYNALGGQQQSAQENFAQAEKASENDQQKLVIKYYKEILGL